MLYPAPAFNVVVLPAQDDVVPLIDGVGFGLTVIKIVELLLHPKALDPVTVYVVFDVGLTETLVPDNEPGIQLYVLAPLPVNTVAVPLHILSTDADELTVGIGFTVTVTGYLLGFAHAVA